MQTLQNLPVYVISLVIQSQITCNNFVQNFHSDIIVKSLFNKRTLSFILPTSLVIYNYKSSAYDIGLQCLKRSGILFIYKGNYKADIVALSKDLRSLASMLIQHHQHPNFLLMLTISKKTEPFNNTVREATVYDFILAKINL